MQKKKQIIGHTEEFTLHFLEEEQFDILFFGKENLVTKKILFNFLNDYLYF